MSLPLSLFPSSPSQLHSLELLYAPNSQDNLFFFDYICYVCAQIYMNITYWVHNPAHYISLLFSNINFFSKHTLFGHNYMCFFSDQAISFSHFSSVLLT